MIVPRPLKVATVALVGFWFLAVSLLALVGAAHGDDAPASSPAAPCPVQPTPCYDVMSVRPEQGVLILFDHCTGNVEVRRYAAPRPSHPAPGVPGSAGGAFTGSSARPAPAGSI